MQECDSFSAWLQWQCSVVVVVVVIFEAGKNTSASLCLVIRGRRSWPRVGRAAAPPGRAGAALCASKCSPWNGAGAWKAFCWLFVGCFIANKQTK